MFFPIIGALPTQINEDWLMLKGCVIGCKKRCITLRKSLMSHSRRIHLEVRTYGNRYPVYFVSNGIL